MGLLRSAGPIKARDPVREEYDRLLIDADRITMQIVQTALSLIGFGFTLHAFFTIVVKQQDIWARRVGLAAAQCQLFEACAVRNLQLWLGRLDRG